MKYNKSDENIYVNDIVKINIGYCKGLLGQVLKKIVDKNTISVKCIYNGFILTLSVKHFTFIQHCTDEEVKVFNKLSRKLIKKYINQYKNIDYIINNWNKDVMMCNNITAKTLNKFFNTNIFNPNVLVSYKNELYEAFLTGDKEDIIKKLKWL